MILQKSKKETTYQLRPSSLLLQLRKNPLILKTSRLELGIDPVVNQLLLCFSLSFDILQLSLDRGFVLSNSRHLNLGLFLCFGSSSRCDLGFFRGNRRRGNSKLGWWKEGWEGKSRTGGRDGGSGRSCRNGRDGGAVKNI